MAISSSFLVLLLAASLCGASKKTYDNYKILTVHPTTRDQLHVLIDLQTFEDETGTDEIDLWDFSPQLDKDVTLAVSPSAYGRVTALLEDAGLTVTVVDDNIQTDIDEEEQQNDAGRSVAFRSTGVEDSFNLNIYHRHYEINEYLDDVASNCGHCEVFNLGQSYEARDMKGIRISSTNTESAGARRGFWIDAGIHAREWIAPATALNMIDKLVHLEREDEQTQRVMNSFDWYIMPSMNPDGYEFSHDSMRLWRKTRSPNGPEGNGHCQGTDANRNWDYHWLEGDGASWSSCSPVYAGSEPFSEPETRNVAQFLEENATLFQVYLSFHAFGQYVLLPWGYTSDLSDDYQALEEAGNDFADAINAYSGRNYTVGQTMNTLYQASGISQDWAKGVAGIPYAYTIELPETMQSRPFHHFALPPEYIGPIGEEIWLGLKAMTRTILEQTERATASAGKRRMVQKKEQRMFRQMARRDQLGN